MKWKKVIRIFIILLLLSGCSSSNNFTRSHMGATVGAVTAGATCYQLLNTGVALTAACAVVGSWAGASAFYNDDLNKHTAVFVDVLNTAPGKRTHTTWNNSTTGSWGSITINRSYLVRGHKCTDYESVISINHMWPMSGVSRGTEFGRVCQLSDGRWKIMATT
jgi:surface antigen